MKRKSEQIPANIIRSVSKHKTQGYQKRKGQFFHTSIHKLSQIITKQILTQIQQSAHNQINKIAHQQLINNIIHSCDFMAINLSQIVCPELKENIQCSIVIDKQPVRVAYDPICGFDKLVTIKNQYAIGGSNGANKSVQSSMLESKSRPFGVFQNSKKQQLNTQKNTNSVLKLVPLDSLDLFQTKSQKQSEKQQTFYRDRIFDSGLPMLSIPQKQRQQKSKNPTNLTSTSKQSSDLHKQQQQSPSSIQSQLQSQSVSQPFIFDYNGQKSLLPSSLMKVNSSQYKNSASNNVLRTTYRVADYTGNNGNSNNSNSNQNNINQNIQDRKKLSLSKNRSSRISNNLLFADYYGNNRNIDKQIIKNQNIKNQNSQILNNSMLKGYTGCDQGQAIKNALQTSFREKEVIFKPVERNTGRGSKIL